MAISAISRRLQAKSSAVLLQLQTRLHRIMLGWLLVAVLACAARIALSPLKEPLGLGIILPYVLLVWAPVVSALLALRWFADGDSQPQPRYRFSIIGRWQNIDRAKALRLMQAHPSLIKRPVVEYDGGVLVGFNPEAWGALR